MWVVSASLVLLLLQIARRKLHSICLMHPSYPSLYICMYVCMYSTYVCIAYKVDLKCTYKLYIHIRQCTLLIAYGHASRGKYSYVSNGFPHVKAPFTAVHVAMMSTTSASDDWGSYCDYIKFALSSVCVPFFFFLPLLHCLLSHICDPCSSHGRADSNGGAC